MHTGETQVFSKERTWLENHVSKLIEMDGDYTANQIWDEFQGTFPTGEREALHSLQL